MNVEPTEKPMKNQSKDFEDIQWYVQLERHKNDAAALLSTLRYNNRNQPEE